eukprot:gene60807-81082_t
MLVALLLVAPGTVWDPLGVAAALAGTLSMAAGTFWSRKWQTQLPVLAFTGWQRLLGGAMLLPVAWWADPPLPALTGMNVLMLGLVVCSLGVVYGWVQYLQTKNLQVHPSMADVSQIIWETCKTYLWQQGKFLAVLWVLIAICMTYYFGVLSGNSVGHVIIILLASVLGILGSYGVAWFGIRINTVANSRAAFSALKGNPLATLLIPLKSGMSVGLLLVATELFFMICILAFLPKDPAGPCFIGV